MQAKHSKMNQMTKNNALAIFGGVALTIAMVAGVSVVDASVRAQKAEQEIEQPTQEVVFDEGSIQDKEEPTEERAADVESEDRNDDATVERVDMGSEGQAAEAEPVGYFEGAAAGEQAPIVYYEEPAPTYTPTSGLTPESGVNYYNGTRETYYSSNILYHYRTPEWTVGADGVYRDSNGYVVVASSDLAQGSVLETSFGTAKVYDTGCPSGTVDVYVNW